MNEMWKRMLGVAVAISVVTGANVMPALASVPSNDTEAGAVVIGAVPFTHTADTTEATPGGPDFCTNSGSAFYRFTPTEDVWIQVDLVGSDYDTTLGAYTRDAEGKVQPLACNDDRLGDSAGVRLRVEAGTTYYFMAGRCCRSGRTGGGELVLTVSEVVTEPLEVTFEVLDTGTVDPETGIATISGTATCNKRSSVYSEGRLRQLRGELFVARGYLGAYGTCAPDAPLEWTVDVETETSVVFGAGPATVTRWYTSAYAGWREWVDEYETVTVTISLA